MAQLNRRRFLQSSAATVGAVTYFQNISALNGFANTPALRRNASNMATNDPIMRGYRRAVAAMKNLPDSNPCSWFYQSAIHGTTVTPVQTAWNTCHIDASFFWAWHRMYLYWFERIVRKYSGMYDWALPYWNWTSSDSAQRLIPAPLRVTTSTLYDGTRNAAMNAGTSGLSSTLGTTVNNTINNQNNYFSAQSAINGPHGSVHVTVGGNMFSVSSAAQDPLFWLHHSEVDRQWNVWLGQGGRSNPVSDVGWRTESFTFFDECCNEVQMTPCQILRAALQLGYEYEDEPTQVNQYCPLRPIIVGPFIPIDWVPIFTLKKEVPYELEAREIRHPIGNLEPANKRTFEDFKNRAKEDSEQNTANHDFVLKLSGIEAQTNPGVSYEVYIGPKGIEPDPKNRYFLGVFGMFSAGLQDRKHHYSPAEYVFPINKRLRRGLLKEHYEVLVVPVTSRGERGADIKPRSKLTIGSISVEAIAPTPAPDKEEQEKLRSVDEER